MILLFFGLYLIKLLAPEDVLLKTHIANFFFSFLNIFEQNE